MNWHINFFYARLRAFIFPCTALAWRDTLPQTSMQSYNTTSDWPNFRYVFYISRRSNSFGLGVVRLTAFLNTNVFLCLNRLAEFLRLLFACIRCFQIGFDFGKCFLKHSIRDLTSRCLVWYQFTDCFADSSDCVTCDSYGTSCRYFANEVSLRSGRERVGKDPFWNVMTFGLYVSARPDLCIRLKFHQNVSSRDILKQIQECRYLIERHLGHTVIQIT